MHNRINIVGTGIGGLLTAYSLSRKFPEQMQIHIYDSQDKLANNATTNSLAWLNALYPSKGNTKGAPSTLAGESREGGEIYDQYRIESIQAWRTLLADLANNAITGIGASQQQQIQIKEQEINSLHVFFNTQQENAHQLSHKRLEAFAKDIQTTKIEKAELVKHFSFIAKLPDETIIHNIAYEQLINPIILRNELINFLQQNNVTFHWNTVITTAMIQSNPSIHWVITAGAGCLPLIANTKLKNFQFHEHSAAELIYFELAIPLDLKGKVFHFNASDTTPAFHLRNNDNNINQLKIVIARQGGKNESLAKIAQAISQLLHIQVKRFYCTDKIIRPMTQDSKPLVEMNLGMHKNIDIIYGHSLFTNAAKIYPEFAMHLIHRMQNKLVNSAHPSGLQQFSSERFSKTFINSPTGIHKIGHFGTQNKLASEIVSQQVEEKKLGNQCGMSKL